MPSKKETSILLEGRRLGIIWRLQATVSWHAESEPGLAAEVALNEAKIIADVTYKLLSLLFNKTEHVVN